MQKISDVFFLRLGALLFVVSVVCVAGVRAQTSREADRNYSASDAPAAAAVSRPRTAVSQRERPLGDTPTDILRAARTIYISPNRHINSDYLEYKLDKLPEFGRWQLSIVKNRERADLVLEIQKTALNYIFSVVEPESSIVVAINGRVAAEDISHQIVKRMRAIRASPANEEH